MKPTAVGALYDEWPPGDRRLMQSTPASVQSQVMHDGPIQ